MKFLLLAVVIVVVLWLLLGRSRKAARGDAPASTAEEAGSPQAMVRCAHCGLHLPRGDAVNDGALSYCGAEHRTAGPRSP